MEKITYVKNYYKGRDEAITNIKIIDKGETVIIQDYEEDIEVSKDNIRILIYGSFIVDVYDVYFVDITKDYKCVGIPLVVGIEGFNNARKYIDKGVKALGGKWIEERLLISHSVTDRGYVI